MSKTMKIIFAVIGIFVFCGVMGVLFGEEEPAPEADLQSGTEQPPAMTAEEYADAVGSQSIRISKAFEAIKGLTGKPVDDGWFVDLLNEATIIQNACSEAKKMEPPEAMKEAHADYMEGIVIADEVAGKLKNIATRFYIDEDGKKIIQNYPAEMEKATLPIQKATTKIKMALEEQ